MARKLFCELCPFTYRLSMEKEILKTLNNRNSALYDGKNQRMTDRLS